jgi:phosphoinositide-3-kinase regulatory subunit 4
VFILILTSCCRERSEVKTQGLVLIVEFICSNLRHLRYPQSKLISLILLLRLAASCDSECILQRIVPFVVLSLDDVVPSVRAMGVRVLCLILSYVDAFLPHEGNIFLKSVFPSLNVVARDPEIVVRVAFAECIGRFAESSKAFLDKQYEANAQKLSSTEIDSEKITSASGVTSPDDSRAAISSVSKLKSQYAVSLEELRGSVSRWVIGSMLEQGGPDSRIGSSQASHSSLIKKIILSDLMRLCHFFGQEQAIDLLLAQLLTMLNDQVSCDNLFHLCCYTHHSVRIGSYDWHFALHYLVYVHLLVKYLPVISYILVSRTRWLM